MYNIFVVFSLVPFLTVTAAMSLYVKVHMNMIHMHYESYA